MSQSRLLSAIEAATNVIVGLFVAIAVQLALFPALGLAMTPTQSLQRGSAFTLASMLRSYALRRLFARLGATADT